jgi:CheY-like chemotaxis protein
MGFGLPNIFARRHRGSGGRKGSHSGSPGRKAKGRALQNVPILVVEDDAASAKLLSLLLRAEGADVRTAYSAEEALATLESFRPRLIAVDIILPRMSGLLLVQHLKAEPWARDIVMVAVTSFNGLEAERVAREAGCAGYILKPVDSDTFASTIARYLGGTP